MAAAIRATDSFDRADSADLGANWDVETGADNAEIFSNTARPSAAATVAVEKYNAVVFASNQFSEVVIDRLIIGGVFAVVGAVARAQAGAQSYYTGEAGGAITFVSKIHKVIAGSESELANAATNWATGDQLRLIVIGTTIGMYKNGILDITASDSALSGGLPGIILYDDPTPNDARIASWLGGDFPADIGELFPKQKMREAIARGFGYA